MKSVLTLVVCLISLSASAKTTSFTGVRANVLVDILARAGLSEGGMGRLDAEAESIGCTKKIDDAESLGSVVCIIKKNFAPSEPIVLSSESESSEITADAYALRELMVEMAENDVISSDSEKKLSVSKISCRGTNNSFIFDDLKIEKKMKCTLVK